MLSPTIESVGYEPEACTLYIRLRNGFIGRYRRIPAEVYAGFMGAERVDAYLHQFIEHYYPYRRLMKMLPVASTSIRSIGYEVSTKTLYIQFNNGFMYEYKNLPPIVYAALMNADSIGAFFNRTIRGKYPYRRLWIEQMRPLQGRVPTTAASPQRQARRRAL